VRPIRRIFDFYSIPPLATALLLLFACIAQSGAAQSSSARSSVAGAQSPVARLSHLAGGVQVQQENATEAPVDAALNMPVVQGERILTAENGEAEVEFPDGSVLRMTSNSTATIGRLSAASGVTEVQLGDGLFYLELRSADGGGYTVYAGDETLAPQQNSSLRVRVTNGQVEAAVLSGVVGITRQNAYTADLQAGESLRTDPRNPRRYLLSDTIPSESWDSWNERLAQSAQDEAAARTPVRDGYAGDQGYGWSDLDANGNWYDVPGEGQVWQPTGVDAGFDPYGYGNWVYGPGGYAWASGYSWGWLPYRCGSWGYYNSFGWGWVPASGCGNFGYGGGGGGYVPVRHPPGGWHPPHRPVVEDPAGLRIHRHPTLPVRLRDDVAAPGATGGGKSLTSTAPVKIAGVMASPIRRVGQSYTPQGGTAVGSSLLRDFPIHAGTHEPALGRRTDGAAVIPGRPAEWRGVAPTAPVAGNGLAGRSPGRRQGVPAGAVIYGGVIYGGVVGYAPGDPSLAAPGYQRLPRSTDPPINANGPPPIGANGPPPVNANGPAPVNANGPAPVSATGAPSAIDRSGFRGGQSLGYPGVPNVGRVPERGPERGIAPRVPSAIAPAQASPLYTPVAPTAPVAPMAPRPVAPAPTPVAAPRMMAPPPSAPVMHSAPAAPAAPAAGAIRAR